MLSLFKFEIVSESKIKTETIKICILREFIQEFISRRMRLEKIKKLY